MSNKKVLAPYKVASNQDMSTSFHTNLTNIQYMDRVAYQLNWTGTPTGSAIVQGSLDNSNWINLGIAPATMSGSSGNWLFDVQVTGIPNLRVSYTATSGAGSLDVYVAAKEA